MEKNEEKPIKPDFKRNNENGRFGPNNNANPEGRPKGKTMKEFAREWLMSMDDEDKKKFLKDVTPEFRWRMAEGNPHQTTDVTSGGKPIPILGGIDTNKE